MTQPLPLAAIVLAAGLGTRMKSTKAKVMHEVAGQPILGHMLATLKSLDAARSVVVVGKGPGQDDVANYARAMGAVTAIQDPPRGTGDAAKSAKSALDGFRGNVIVLYGDNPLLTAATLNKLLAAKADGVSLALMGFRPAEPAPYGRLVLGKSGDLEAIVEARDATPEQRGIGLCNAGGFLLDAELLFSLLADVKPDNAQGEFYLTDIVKLARARNLRCVAVEVPADDVLGVNTRAELALVEAIYQVRRRLAAMLAGVTLADPNTVYFSHDTKIGTDVSIGQNVVFGPGVTLAGNVTIKPFCHLEGVTVAEGAIIGPFARLRPGSEIGPGAHIGNFVETKNAKIGKGAKANHLTYLGDTKIGAGSNIGAGTITCNYDGFDKHHTEIGENVFIGSNTALVAPVKIGDGAIVGAGSVITKEVSPEALAVERAKQTEVDGWATKFRARKRAEKEAKAKSKKG